MSGTSETNTEKINIVHFTEQIELSVFIQPKNKRFSKESSTKATIQPNFDLHSLGKTSYLRSYNLPEFNISVLKDLTQNGGYYFGLFEPLDFFNLLYKQFAIVLANKTNPDLIIKHIRSLNYGTQQLSYLTYRLRDLIKEFIKLNSPIRKSDFENCEYHIEKERLRLNNILFPSESYELVQKSHYIFKNKGRVLKNYKYHTELDAYLNTDINIEIYETITENVEWSEIFEPLDFFNLLYKQLEILKENKDSKLAVRDYLLQLDIDRNQLYFLLHYITELLTNYIATKDEQLSNCLVFIKKEYLKLQTERELEEKHIFKNTSQDTESIVNTQIKNLFKLADKKGTKTNLIRILNAVYELRILYKPNDDFPTKLEFMKSFGEFCGVDLSRYAAELSQSLNNQPIEINIAVFKEMIRITEMKHSETK